MPTGAVVPTARVSLSAVERQLVRRLIERVVPGAVIAVFGSRATGRARPHSDLDLLFIDPPRLGWAQRADLRDLFEASDLPFAVDLVDAAGLPQGMAQRVMAEAVALD
jgi:predicted nucleotidyltransferase